MTDDGREPGQSSISLVNLALASFGSLAATFLLARLGVAGTLIGAALTPIVIALAQELVRRPIRRIEKTGLTVFQRPGASARDNRGSPRSNLASLAHRVSWRSVLVTGGLAFAMVVAAFTIADFAAGDSVVADRPSTFIPTRREKPSKPSGTVPPAETVAPAETGKTETTEPPEADTVPDETPAPTSETDTSETDTTVTEEPPPEPIQTETAP